PGKDITPPSIPAGLTAASSALSATTSSVALSWSAASDNLAVTGYAIYRNGSQIATSTKPSFSDGPVVSGVSYSYAVLAFDAAGNRSALGSPVAITPTVVNLGVTVGGGLSSALLGL